MKMPNYSSRYVATHAAADLAKALQTPIQESPFQVGESQLKAIKELAKILMKRLEPQTGMNFPPPQPH